MYLDKLTPHEKLYEKAKLLGFPETIDGYKIIYEHKYSQCDLEFSADIFIEIEGQRDKDELGHLDEGLALYGPPAIKIMILKRIADNLQVLRQPSIFDLMKG